MKNQIEAAGVFTQRLWDLSEDLFQKLVRHPFALGLADASLSGQSFKHYLSQDLYYLEKDAAAFMLVAQRAADSNERYFLQRMATETVALEQDLNISLSRKFDVIKAKSPSDVIASYSEYLSDAAENANYAVALAALLPCFWLYTEVGIHIYKGSVPQNPYQSWIDCYHCPSFIKEVESFIAILENQARGKSLSVQNQMQNAFIKASQYELAFFDEAIACSAKKQISDSGAF